MPLLRSAGCGLLPAEVWGPESEKAPSAHHVGSAFLMHPCPAMFLAGPLSCHCPPYSYRSGTNNHQVILPFHHSLGSYAIGLQEYRHAHNVYQSCWMESISPSQLVTHPSLSSTLSSLLHFLLPSVQRFNHPACQLSTQPIPHPANLLPQANTAAPACAGNWRSAQERNSPDLS